MGPCLVDDVLVCIAAFVRRKTPGWEYLPPQHPPMADKVKRICLKMVPILTTSPVRTSPAALIGYNQSSRLGGAQTVPPARPLRRTACSIGCSNDDPQSPSNRKRLAPVQGRETPMTIKDPKWPPLPTKLPAVMLYSGARLSLLGTRMRRQR